MKKKLLMSPEEAIELIKDGDVVATGGFIGTGLPEIISSALEEKYKKSGFPKDLTLVFAAGQGSKNGDGNDHFAHKGLIKRVIGGHWAKCPKMGEMANNNEIEAYNFPQGVICQMYRDISIQQKFTLSKIGLYTFVDPRISGGKLNSVTTEDMVKVVNIEGNEMLLYKHVPIDICLLKGTYADEKGNISFEKEPLVLDATSLAQACKASGGKVLVQVEKIVKNNTLDPKLVKVPGIYVDGVVLGDEKTNCQSLGIPFDPSLCGEKNVVIDRKSSIELDSKKVIARRAALELKKWSVINLGIGTPEYISNVAVEEKIDEYLTFTIESGIVGGIALKDIQFGTAKNPDSIMDHRLQFDFYDGGGLDMAYLGLAEGDMNGNVNVSKFGQLIAGCGGFINITQSAKKVFFCGTFTAGGLKTEIKNGKLSILTEGKKKKFVKKAEQITFSGEYAQKKDQAVMFITERAVFELKKDGLYLTEIAPGIDLKKDILDQMDFTPLISKNLKLMDERIFCPETMNLEENFKRED